MSFDWEFPLVLIRHGGGYASLVRDGSQDIENGEQSMVVFTSDDDAMRFMEQTQLMGRPSMLKNAREFRTLLQCLKHPVTHVMVNPNVLPELEHAWEGTVADVIETLVIDFSPWNYPAFAISVESGFASIEAGDGVTAVAIFGSEEKANEYMNALSLEGELFAIANLNMARQLLGMLRDSTNAVALDPVFEEGQHSAEYGFSIDSLLEKYLVHEE